MPKFHIKARHEFYVTYIIEKDTLDEAIDTLCNTELIGSYSGGQLVGINDYVLEREGIEVEDQEIECSYACPTGRASTRRDWEWEEEEEEEEEVAG